MVRRLFILFSIILAMSGCGRSRKTPVRIPQASDSLYTAQAALKIYGKEPERALAIIDSALVVGNVSEFKADFLRAKILAGSLEVVQRDAAIILCERLLLHDSTQVVDKTTSVNRNNVLDVMLGACRTNGEVSWSYTGSRPGTHWEFADIGEHDLAASKDLFDKNPDIMKEAATVGGLTSGYTIIWKNLNGTEDSNFTYEVKF